MEEIWKDIEGYDGRYSVSNLGSVRSNSHTFNYFWRGKWITKTTRTKILRPGVGGGYLFVILRHDNESKPHSIHRLVASAFLSNPESLPCVNHIDGNKLNNKVTNLEWCTAEYNAKHALQLGLSKLPNPGHLVQCVETGVIYSSQTAAGKAYGVSQAAIRNSIIEGSTFRGLHFIEISKESL